MFAIADPLHAYRRTHSSFPKVQIGRLPAKYYRENVIGEVALPAGEVGVSDRYRRPQDGANDRYRDEYNLGPQRAH